MTFEKCGCIISLLDDKIICVRVLKRHGRLKFILIHTCPALEFLRRKCKHKGFPKLKFNACKITPSISRMSFLVYALSVIYTKSATSGAYISSYFDAINIDVTPTS